MSARVFPPLRAVCLAFLLLPLPLFSLQSNPQEAVPELKIGDPLPLLSGEFLSGKKAVLPEACRGKTALLALGFTYESRHAVEAWIARFRKDFGKDPGVSFFEVPMIGGAGRMGRWFIDSGMRRGTPKELHENVVTVYGGIAPWKRRLRVKNEDVAYLVLVDGQGIVRWLHSGKLEEESYKDLAAVVARLIQSAPVHANRD